MPDNFIQVAVALLPWSDSLQNTGKHVSYRRARNKQPNNKKFKLQPKLVEAWKLVFKVYWVYILKTPNSINWIMLSPVKWTNLFAFLFSSFQICEICIITSFKILYIFFVCWLYTPKSCITSHTDLLCGLQWRALVPSLWNQVWWLLKPQPAHPTFLGARFVLQCETEVQGRQVPMYINAAR